jgi:hypothetical protein
MVMRLNGIKRIINTVSLWVGFICFITNTNGAPVDSITAKTVAANFYAQKYNVTGLNLTLAYSEWSSQNEAEYYIYNISPGKGFVIVSADDAAHPVIGYSNEGCFPHSQFTIHNSQLISPEFVFWMQHYKKQIEYIRLHSLQASPEIQDEWNSYKNNLALKSPKKVMQNVSPLLQTEWAQSPYFNAYCPDNCVAGCVATAMGQVMKYWAYPPHGMGMHTYTDGGFGNLTANFDTTHYNWAAMPDIVSSSNPSVAILMYDCGVGVDMRYTSNSSGSFVITGDSAVCAQTAFVQYFGYYGASIQGLYQINYSGEDWLNLLENELTNNRPLLYVGEGNQGGHAWVCDGDEAGGNFHMNWGWAGYEDGYYTLNSLNPDNIPLDSDEEALIGIEPAVAIADFKANPLFVWAGDTVTFFDNSFGPVPIISWQWTLPGSSAPGSTSQNPEVIYNTPGIYNVTETVTTSEGTNALTRFNYITVLQNNEVNVYPTLNNGSFTVQLHDAALAGSNLTFCLYDIAGRKIFTTTLTQYITPLTVVVRKGVYMFRAYDASEKPVATGKVVIM